MTDTDPELAADGASYCPAFALLDEATDAALGAALGRVVTDGCPEPLPGETRPQWWTVTATAGVGTDDDGRPAHGEDIGVVDLGQGEGVLLVTDQAAACALTAGELRGDAAALVLSFDLEEVVAVEPDRSLVRRQVRAMTVELSGASWGAVGFAIGAEVDRGDTDTDTGVARHGRDGDTLVARLTRADDR
ncbi:MAG: hypothetical protein ABW195_03880 [Ilumatobacteraceae bacterium]